MNCPICNKEMRIDTEQVGVDYDNIPIFHRFAYCDNCMRKKDIDIDESAMDQSKINQARFAREELGKIEKAEKITAVNNSGIIIIFVAAGVCLLVGAFPLTILLVIIGLYQLIVKSSKDNRKNQLEQISAGKKIINVCPKCKSDNIVMDMVQKGSFTMHGTSRIADNINPLHPFTHTNIHRGNDYSSAIYGNQCYCRDCGNVFDRPEVHYI